MRNIQVFAGYDVILQDLALAVIPLIVLFLFFQVCFLKLSKRKFINIIKGFVLTFVGLSIFLQGIYVGFLPAGKLMGATLAGMSHNWILIPIGFVVGFVTTLAEPAVRTLNYEVEKASGGYIPQQIMLYALSIGVAVSIALSMGRIIFGIPIWYFIFPGYLFAFVLARWTSRPFVAVAFDSGGVATGPMTVTFILAITLGAASALEGRDPLLEGFGMIAMVALSSILSVLTLGVLYGRKEKEIEREIAGELQADSNDCQQKDGKKSGGSI